MKRLTSYERAVQEDPSVVWYYINQVNILLDMGRRDEALSVIDHTTRHCTLTMQQSMRDHGQVLRRLERYEDAIKTLCQSNPNVDSANMRGHGTVKGLCHAALDQWDEALHCYLAGC